MLQIRYDTTVRHTCGHAHTHSYMVSRPGDAPKVRKMLLGRACPACRDAQDKKETRS